MRRSGFLLACHVCLFVAAVAAQDFNSTLTGTLVPGEFGTIHLLSGDTIPQFIGTDFALSGSEDASFESGGFMSGSVAGDAAGSFTLRVATLLLTTNASGHQGDGYSAGTFTLASPTSGTISGLFISDVADFVNVTGYLVGDPTLGTGYFNGKTFVATVSGAYAGTHSNSFSGTVAGTVFDSLGVTAADEVQTMEMEPASARVFDLPSSTSILQFVPLTGTSSFDLATTSSPNMQLEVGLQHTGLVLGVGESGLPGTLSFASAAHIVIDSLSPQYVRGFAVGTFDFTDGFNRGKIKGIIVADVSPGDATYPVRSGGYLFATQMTNLFEPFFAIGTIDGGYYDASGEGTLDAFDGQLQLSMFLRPGNVSYFFETGDEDWTTGGAPAAFTMPDTDYFDGELHLMATNNTNTFGFWQTPAGAIMKNDRDLYRGIFQVESNLVNKTIVPTLRLRVAETNNQSASVLALESIGAAQSSPDIAGSVYQNYFRPPTATSTPLYLAFDMLNFSPDDASYGVLSLDMAVVERITLPGNLVFSNVASYDFDTDEGWTFVSVPGVFTAPVSDVSGGALVLTSTTNTNTFGYWQSPIINIAGDYLYRVRYEVTTDITPQSLVPTMRLRINANNLQESEMVVIESSGTGESSPLPPAVSAVPPIPACSGKPNPQSLIPLEATTPPEYEVYFIPPVSALGGADAGIRLAFDVLNFNPADAPSGSLFLQRVEISRAPIEQ